MIFIFDRPDYMNAFRSVLQFLVNLNGGEKKLRWNICYRDVEQNVCAHVGFKQASLRFASLAAYHFILYIIGYMLVS